MNTNLTKQSPSIKDTARLKNPTFRVVSTWIWWLLGAVLTLLIITLLLGEMDAGLTAVFAQHPHLVVYVELVSVGLLPVLFTIICHDDLTRYGFKRQGWLKGLALSLMFVIFMYAVGYLMNGQIISDGRDVIVLPSPWNIFYSLLSILVWGPLEVFFVVWLIENTDDIFKSQEKLFSWGLVLTVVIFSLIHIPTTDMFNAVYTGFIFLILGLIFKYTRNIYGPMLAWTLINGQVWFMAGMLLT